jgi:Domain of unknown function (DUF4304)
MDERASAWIALLRELKKQLGELGFEADGPRFYLRSEHGDYAIIELQKSVGGYAGGLDDFVVDIAVVPAPWLDWMRTRFPESRTSWTACPDQASGMWRDRLRPDPNSSWDVWALGVGGREGGIRTANQIAERVRTSTGPLLRSLLKRGNLLAKVEDVWAYRAALLVDARPRELPLLLEQCDHPERRADFIAWLRGYAAGERASQLD